MKDFGMGICPQCGTVFKKSSSVHRFCTRECKRKNHHKLREVGRIRLGRKRKYDPKLERRRVERDKIKIAIRDKAKKAFPIPQPCEACGAQATDRHHDNYNKPFEIRWFCSPCHKQWHRENKAIQPVTQGQQITLGF